MKKILIRLIPVILFLGGFIIYDIIHWGEQSEKDQIYFEKLNLILSGEVDEIVRLEYGHDYGVITVDLKNCNRKYYDGRDKKQFIGIIKDNKAKLIVMNVSEIQKKDSIYLNVRNFKIKRNDRKISEDYKLGIPPTSIMNNPWSEIKNLMEN